MGLPPRSDATDAHHCIMVEVLPDLPHTSVSRALRRTTASSPRIEKPVLTGQAPYKPDPGMNRGRTALRMRPYAPASERVKKSSNPQNSAARFPGERACEEIGFFAERGDWGIEDCVAIVGEQR